MSGFSNELLPISASGYYKLKYKLTLSIKDTVEYYVFESYNQELKSNFAALDFAKRVRHQMVSVNSSINVLHKFQNLSTIYVITCVDINNINEMADLTRFLNTIRLVPKLVWIVVENEKFKAKKLELFLKRSGIRYVHLNVKSKKQFKFEQYDEGFNWLRSNYLNIDKNGVIYLTLLQSSYEKKIFEIIRKTYNIMVFPVGFTNKSLYSRPICKDNQVIDWYCPWNCSNTSYPIDISAFSINIRLIIEYYWIKLSNFKFSSNIFFDFLTKFPSIEKFEASFCTEVYVRNTHTQKPLIKYQKVTYDKNLLEII